MLAAEAAKAPKPAGAAEVEEAAVAPKLLPKTPKPPPVLAAEAAKPPKPAVVAEVEEAVDAPTAPKAPKPPPVLAAEANPPKPVGAAEVEEVADAPKLPKPPKPPPVLAAEATNPPKPAVDEPKLAKPPPVFVAVDAPNPPALAAVNEERLPTAGAAEVESPALVDGVVERMDICCNSTIRAWGTDFELSGSRWYRRHEAHCGPAVGPHCPSLPGICLRCPQ